MLTKCYFITYVIFLLVGFKHCDDYITDMVNSLENILKFCVQNENVIDVNLLFGVAIVSGQIPFVERSNMKQEVRRKLTSIADLCGAIFEIAFQRNIANINSDKTQNIWLSPELWSFDRPTTYLRYPEERKSYFTRSRMEQDVTNTSVFHAEYEFCVRYLIEKCQVSKYCLKLILNENSEGYVLTHQILYLHVLRQLIYQKSSCSLLDHISTNGIHRALNDKCCKVRTELNETENRLLRNAMLLDLFIEEVVVCGLQNFAEFFKLKYIDYILDEQTLNFSSSRYGEITSSTVHMMSVRMGAIVLYLKQISKNYTIT